MKKLLLLLSCYWLIVWHFMKLSIQAALSSSEELELATVISAQSASVLKRTEMEKNCSHLAVCGDGCGEGRRSGTGG